MGDVLFTFDVGAPPDAVRRALTTSDGIASFWTDKAEVPAEVGATLTLGFPDAPVPFDLVLAQSDDEMITWRTATFPPQWVGTDIRWEISGGDGDSTVAFRHGTFTDERRRAGLPMYGVRWWFSSSVTSRPELLHRSFVHSK